MKLIFDLGIPPRLLIKIPRMKAYIEYEKQNTFL